MIGDRPRVLLSYWYGRKIDWGAMREATAGWDVILDSGAFTAHRTGQTIRVQDYAEWLRRWDGGATAAFNLDVIGDPVASARNFQRLVDADTGLTIIPVHHAGTADRHLDAMLEAGVTYVGFGGLVAHYQNQNAVTRWAAWNLRRCAEAGAVAHGLGFTAASVKDLPFYSVDSSTWLMGSRRGFLCAFHPGRGIIQQAQLRNPRSLVARADALRASGVDVRALTRPGFLAAGEAGRADRHWVDRQSARAFWRLEAYLRERHQVEAPAAIAPALPGTRVYLATSTLSDFRLVAGAWAEHTERTPV